MACCGRSNVRGVPGAKAYYERYGYMTKQQIAEKNRVLGTHCNSCDALTVSNEENKCSVCGNAKTSTDPKNGNS